jgi:uncharacterized protein YprB with RNaseH-like and TPR domain
LEGSWEAYLDIETTGLSPDYCQVTVVGIYMTNGAEERVIQLVGEKITSDSILDSLKGVARLYTYNGRRFDLPFIRARYGVDLEYECEHTDLMHHCWNSQLFGGLKAVEQRLGIARQVKGVDGLEAVRLWWRYVNDYDQTALTTLLEYNKEDVVNLRTLKEKLVGKRKQKGR